MPCLHAEVIQDRQLLAYARLTENYWQIWVIDMNTKAKRQLTHSPLDKRDPAWFPDGKRLVYRTANGELFVIDYDQGKEQQLLADFQQLAHPQISPDGRWLLLARHRVDAHCKSDLWLARLDSDSTAERQLIQVPGTDCVRFQPSWSPNEEAIVYAAGNEPEEELAVDHIWIAKRDGRNAHPLTQGNSVNLSPKVSPDGKTIAFSSNRTGDFEIWLMDIQGEVQRPITYSPGLDTDPVWSGDGAQIAFVSNRGGRLRIWLMNADGSQPHPLTGEDEEAMNPAWYWARDTR